MCFFRIGTALSLCAVLISSVCASETGDQQQDSPEFLFPGVTYASIATETEKPTSEAPAVISVITAEDLHNHGITSIEQALEEVPGVYSPYRFLTGNFVFRGVRSQISTNPEILLLVDGIPHIEVFDGVNQLYITRIPIANIQRIEIIRGPGSAVYGADAFAGVINVITKTYKDYHGDEFRGRAGSYDTQEADAILKGNLDNIGTLLSVQARTTDGHRPLITADAQTFFDTQFGTNSSLAPDKANTYFKEVNAILELFSENWRIRFQARSHKLGLGVSFNNALSDTGDGFADTYTLDYFYDNSDLLKEWIFKIKIGALYTRSGQDKPLLPPGAVNGTFPDGVIQEFEQVFRHNSIDIKGFYKGSSQHELIVGAGAYYGGNDDIHEKINFSILPGNVVIPIGSLMNVASDQTFIPEKTRRIKYINFNDDWNLVRDTILSYGARYDDYSDIGGTFNPRIALIWLTTQELTTKLIANRAFRAPTFVELYSRNNSFQQGNPDLDPSIIETLEIALEKRMFNNGALNLSISHHRITDFIETIQTASGQLVSMNSSSDITGNAFELEAILPLAKDITLKSSYSYQRNMRDGREIYNAASHHKVYAGLDWQFKNNWSLYTNVLFVRDFTRDINDPRDDLGSSTFVGTVLQYSSPTNRWDSYLSIRNIFDEVAVSPSDDYRFLPNDYPLPGTHFIFEVRYRM